MTQTNKAAEPVAWRWRPKGAEVWIYNPEPEWLGRQSRDEIDAEPIYTHPQDAESLRAEVVRLRDALKKRTLQDIERLVDWLNADEDNSTLLLNSLTSEQMASVRATLQRKAGE